MNPILDSYKVVGAQVFQVISLCLQLFRYPPTYRLLYFLNMPVATAGYCHDAFIGLPSVVDAGKDLQAKGGRDVINDVLGPLFTQHGVEEK